jgi:ElaB/YqjD/DUF883 family membrane-anchored ribosome-binding protein
MTMNAEIDESVTQDVNVLAKEVAQLRGDLADLSDKVEDYIGEAEAKLVNGAQRIGRRAWDEIERDATTVLEEIENNPVAAVSVAVAIGALVGIFVTLRSR